MGFKIKAYDKLTIALDKQVDALRGKHNAPSQDKLSQPRKHQVEVLAAAVAQLEVSTLSIEERAKVLSGMMLIFRKTIKDTYIIRSPENSIFYGALGDMIGISKDNVLDSNTASLMLGEAMKFVASHVFRDGNTTKPLREVHLFSKIDQFDFQAFWDKGVDMQAAYRKQVCAESKVAMEYEVEARKEAALKEEAERRGPQTSYLGSFVGMLFSTKPAKPEEKIEDMEVNFTIGS